jgi:hypothetical protein
VRFGTLAVNSPPAVGPAADAHPTPKPKRGWRSWPALPAGARAGLFNDWYGAFDLEGKEKRLPPAGLDDLTRRFFLRTMINGCTMRQVHPCGYGLRRQKCGLPVRMRLEAWCWKCGGVLSPPLLTAHKLQPVVFGTHEYCCYIADGSALWEVG